MSDRDVIERNRIIAEKSDEIERLAAENAALRDVIRWALGEGDSFPDWPESVTIKGNPKYWWRTELRRRFDSAMEGSHE